jgi:predicted RNase H-like HicB family nuclease
MAALRFAAMTNHLSAEDDEAFLMEPFNFERAVCANGRTLSEVMAEIRATRAERANTVSYDGPLTGPALDKPHPMDELYEKDLVLWAEHQEKALLELRIDDVDFANVAEEIRCYGRKQEHDLSEHIRSMITTCLKWKYCRDAREKYEHLTCTWYVQMQNYRVGIEVPLECSPSLQAKVPEILAHEYPHARWWSSMETGHKESYFPETLEWTLEEMVNFHLDPLVLDDAVLGYALVISRELDTWEAYSPDFSSIAFGKTPQKCRTNYAKVLDLEIQRLREEGKPIPEPTNAVEASTLTDKDGVADWRNAIRRNRLQEKEVQAAFRARRKIEREARIDK